MNGKPAALLLSGVLVACAQTQPPEATTSPAPSPPPAQAQAPSPAQAAAVPPPADHIVSIRRARCEDLLGLAPDDRAAASMFYIGYQASRLRTSTINVGVIPSIEEQPSPTARSTLTERLSRPLQTPTHELEGNRAGQSR